MGIIRAHPVCFGALGFLTITLPGTVEFWWALFSEKPLAAALSEEIAKIPDFPWLAIVFLPIGFLLFGVILYQQAVQKKKAVIGRRFQGEIVQMDGSAFDQCNFVDCVFQWHGGPFDVINCRFEGTNRFETKSGTITLTVDFLKALGFLDPGFAADWKHLPPGHFKKQ